MRKISKSSISGTQNHVANAKTVVGKTHILLKKYSLVFDLNSLSSREEKKNENESDEIIPGMSKQYRKTIRKMQKLAIMIQSDLKDKFTEKQCFEALSVSF